MCTGELSLLVCNDIVSAVIAGVSVVVIIVVFTGVVPKLFIGLEDIKCLVSESEFPARGGIETDESDVSSDSRPGERNQV